MYNIYFVYSYIRVKNNPLMSTNYNVTVTSLYTNASTGEVDVGSFNYKMPIHHDSVGVAKIEIRWPLNIVGTQLNLTVVELWSLTGKHAADLEGRQPIFRIPTCNISYWKMGMVKV